MHEAGTQRWCSETTHRDGVEMEVGVGFGIVGHMYTHGWFMLMYVKNHHTIVK